MKNVTVVTDASFKTDVLDAEGAILVDFWAPWCGPCRAVAPILEKVAELYDGKVRVAKLNVDENPVTAETYGIRSIPTIALFQGGELVDGVLGAAPLAFFTDMLEKHLSAGAPKARTA
jgi:thioredoxin 1